MRLAQSLFFLVAAALALAVGSTNAADEKPSHAAKVDKKAAASGDKIGTDKNDPGFNVLDKNHDGYLSQTEAAGNPTLAKKFKDADRNGDGKLSRAEYLMTMTAQDARTAKKKMENAMDRHDDKNSSAGTTSSKK